MIESNVKIMGDSSKMNDRDKLIHTILFSEYVIILVDLAYYCIVNERPIFRNEIRDIIRQGGLEIIDDRILYENEKVYWKIQLNK